jgi:septin family protein
MAQPLSDAQTNVRFNVMTLGQHCAGKAAFFRSLLESDENNSTDCLESESYAKDNFRGQRITDLKAPKASKIVEVGRSSLKTKSDDFISLVMYDTPSYEDFAYDKNLVDVICGHIEESHSAWRSLDLQVQRSKRTEEFILLSTFT